MAKIRYLVNNDPYASMVAAIKSENIAYARFYNNFKELWGRFSTNNFDDEFVLSDAIRDKDGVEVLGDSRIYLFSDSEYDYKYTKKFCSITGADYELMLSDLSKVESFYVDLAGYTKVGDFTNKTLFLNSMDHFTSKIESYEMDQVIVSFVVDSEFDDDVSGLTLLDLRSLSLNIDYNSSTYISRVDGIESDVSYRSLPTSEYNEDEDKYEYVEGSLYSLSDYSLKVFFGTYVRYTSAIDSVFSSISVDEVALDDREENGVVYKRSKYIITFKFDSTVDEETGDVINKIDWEYIRSDSYADSFTDRYSEYVSWYDANKVANEYGGFNTILLTPPSNTLVVTVAFVSVLDDYDDRDAVFYTKKKNLFGVKAESYLRYESLPGVVNRDIADVIMLSIHYGYKKDDDGWFGGSDFGHFLEGMFSLVVVAVALVLTVILENPYPLLIAVGVLYGAAKYTGMSQGGQQFAATGIKVLQIASIVYSVYAIYDIAYNLAVEDSITLAMQNGDGVLTEEATLSAVGDVGFSDVVAQMTFSDAMNIADDFYSIFNLLSPADKPSQSDDVEYEDENTHIYNIDASYDMYDDIYNIYEM